CGTDDCGRTSGPSRPSTTPSPPSTRPSGARGRRSFVFVREDGETATDSALLVGHHHRLDRRDQFATMVAFTEGFRGSWVELRRLRRLRSACRAEPGTACFAGGRVKSRRPDCVMLKPHARSAVGLSLRSDPVYVHQEGGFGDLRYCDATAGAGPRAPSRSLH